MADAVVSRIYHAVKVLKRFVAVPDGVDALAAVFRLCSGDQWHAMAGALFRSLPPSGLEDSADDEVVSQMGNVDVVAVSPAEDVDIRVWQLVLVLGGQHDGADLLVRWASSRRGGGGPTSPVSPGEGSWRAATALSLTLFRSELLGLGSSVGEAPSDDGVSVAVFRPFELILSMSCFSGLEQDVRRASMVSSSSRVAAQLAGEEPSYEDRLASSLRGSFARICAIVRDVISGWDALARTRGFRSAKVMLSSYLLWSPATGGVVAMGRPEDAESGVVAPHGQGTDLLTGRGPSLRGRPLAWSEVQQLQDDAVQDILSLGDAQLRAAASMMLEHVYTCTAAGSLGIAVTRSMAKRGVGGGVGSRLMEGVQPRSAAVGSSVAGVPEFTSRQAAKKRKTLGRLSVDMYRPPTWDRCSNLVPPTLQMVARGLTAFKVVSLPRDSPPFWAASKAVIQRWQSPPSPADLSSLQLAYRADCSVAGLYVQQLCSLAAPGIGGRRGLLLWTGRTGADAPDDVIDAPNPVQLREAWQVVNEALSQVAANYVCGFDHLVRAHADAWADARSQTPFGCASSSRAVSSSSGAAAFDVLPQFLGSQVQLVLCDPPYGTRSALRLDESSHDVLTEADMRSAVVLYRTLIRPGGHLLLFCLTQQLNPWMETLKALVDVNPSGLLATLPAFSVDSHPLVAIKEPHAVNTMRSQSTNLSNKADFIVHATRRGASAEKAFVQVNYRTWNIVPSQYPAHDNFIDHVRPPHYNEVVRRRRDGSRPWLRPEQKSLALILELVLRFSQPGDIVVDAFAGTCVTAAACIRAVLGQHRLVVSCDSDPVVIQASLPRVRREFVNQLLTGATSPLASPPPSWSRRPVSSTLRRRQLQRRPQPVRRSPGACARGDSRRCQQQHPTTTTRGRCSRSSSWGTIPHPTVNSKLETLVGTRPKRS